MTYILTSRKFWTSILMILVVIASTFIPGFDLDIEAAAGFAIIAVTYIIGVAVDPGPGGWRGWIQSRKFWAAVFGFLVLILNSFGVQLPFGLTSETLVLFSATIGALIAGIALEKRRV